VTRRTAEKQTTKGVEHQMKNLDLAKSKFTADLRLDPSMIKS
jgi:hypothetical protein